MELGESDTSGRATPRAITGSEFILPADQIVKAIGQQKPALAAALNLQTSNDFISVNNDFETSQPGVFAIGDCIRSQGSASTVMAVQDGKMAAQALHDRLTNTGTRKEEVLSRG